MRSSLEADAFVRPGWRWDAAIRVARRGGIEEEEEVSNGATRSRTKSLAEAATAFRRRGRTKSKERRQRPARGAAGRVARRFIRLFAAVCGRRRLVLCSCLWCTIQTRVDRCIKGLGRRLVRRASPRKAGGGGLQGDAGCRCARSIDKSCAGARGDVEFSSGAGRRRRGGGRSRC